MCFVTGTAARKTHTAKLRRVQGLTRGLKMIEINTKIRMHALHCVLRTILGTKKTNAGSADDKNQYKNWNACTAPCSKDCSRDRSRD